MAFNKNFLIYLVVFLFPILVVTVNNGGGVLYVLFLLFSLIYGWPAWKALDNREKNVLLGFLAFFILVSISLINTQDIVNGMKKAERLLQFPLLIPMYLLLKRYEVETGKIFFLGLLVASVVIFFQSLYQVYFLELPRASGAYNPLLLGDVSMLIIAIVICAFLTVINDWKSYLLGAIVICFAMLSSLMSGSRGAWVLVPFAFLWFLWIKRKNLKTYPVLSIISLIVILILAGMSNDKVRHRVDIVSKAYDEYSQGIIKNNSVTIRLEMWRDSLQIWKDHPIIGTGIGDFENTLIYSRDTRFNLKRKFDHAHNIYFDVLATAGVLGLIGLLLFVLILPFSLFYSYWNEKKDPWIKFYALSGMTTIIAFSVFGLTEGWLSRHMFVRTYLMSMLVFMTSISVAKDSR